MSLGILPRILDAPRPVVLIDGPSGAGKSSLARALASEWPGTVQLVSLDALYPGWGGLAAGSAAVADTVLHDTRPGFIPWDWHAGRPGVWVSLDVTLPVIIEGCGALTRANRARATFGIWVDADASSRRARALGREEDDDYATHWDEWAASEAEHWRRDRPWELADVRVSPAGFPS